MPAHEQWAVVENVTAFSRSPFFHGVPASERGYREPIFQNPDGSITYQGTRWG